MKTIEPVLIWDNGVNKEAEILSAYASIVKLNNSATFEYFLFDKNDEGFVGELLRQGTIYMNPENYALWNTDDVAWDFVAAELKLTITGDYVPPVPVPPTTETGNLNI